MKSAVDMNVIKTRQFKTLFEKFDGAIWVFHNKGI
jgi:hypothetical protein